MPAYEKQNRSEYSTSDQACTRCRERKIRCGRERPQCNNCERDDSVTCVYQNPAKRVNHLKSLFDSVSGVQDRLTTIESHLGRLTVSIARSMDQDDPCSTVSSRQASADRRSFDDDDDDDRSESPSPHSDDSAGLHVFHNQVDMVDWYHGPSSLFVLCNRFRSRVLTTSNATECGLPLQDMLQILCENAGAVEPFPPFSDQSLINLLPKQQAITAIGHFFQHVDCTTDIFVQSNLLANLERVYSQPTEPGDDAWAICFKAITLLVLGKEISAQASNALFGDFARSFLPSRAALVNSRLLTTPRLINVQTLILLSVAAQQFDPPGWAELIFTYACMLARTMGLHHAQLFPHEASTDEALERAKVVQSLYSQDKSLCTTRGSVSWLPSYDCNIASQLSGAVERQAPYSDRCQLAMIQDDIYRLTHAISRRTSKHGSTTKSQAAQALQSIEQQLDQYARIFGIFDSQASYYNSPRRAMIPLEFLTTRILALQHGSEPRHAEQVRSDARASCLLLLIAHGAQDRQVVDAFNSLTSHTTSPSPRNKYLSATEASTISFASVLDAFSVPAFFILLKHLLQSTENDSIAESNTDLNLLRRVSACYTNSTGRMQSNSYHRKVTWIFDQLLAIIDLLKHPRQPPPGSVPQPASISEIMLPNSSPHIPSLQLPAVDFFNVSTSPLKGDQPPPAGTSFSWDNWSSVPSSLGPNTPFGSSNSVDVSGTVTSDLLAQILGSSQCHPDGSGQSMTWSASAPEPPTARKRLRTHDESDIPIEKNGPSPMSEFLVSSQEMPFDF